MGLVQTATPSAIAVQAVNKHFGSFQALRDVSLAIASGSLTALLGPSGSGKSTLLRLIAGLETPDTGRVLLAGQDATFAPVQGRNIGFVFQHYALFKHMTVRENIAFGLDIRKVPKAQIRDRVEHLLDLIQLAGFGNRYPSQLSGGQRQRVALARALAVEPQVLLLDEPFGALDAKVRQELRQWLRRLHEEVPVTTVFVTHDQEEAMEVASQVVVMNQGVVEQVGSPRAIYENPATPFVMNFVGQSNRIPAQSDFLRLHGHTRPGEVYVRPHDVAIEVTPQQALARATIKDVIYLGREVQVSLELADTTPLLASVDRYQHLDLQPGQIVYVRPRHVQVFGEAAPSNHAQQSLTLSL